MIEFICKCGKEKKQLTKSNFENHRWKSQNC